MADYATLLRDHVRLTCRSVDRIFLQAYVPRLQSAGMVCQFLRWQRGFPIPSAAAFGKIGDAYAAEVHRFARENSIPVRYFAKGERKEEIARPFIQAAAAKGASAVALIGIAQEKASAWRSWPARGQRGTAHPHMEWGRQMVFVNHFYFYFSSRASSAITSTSAGPTRYPWSSTARSAWPTRVPPRAPSAPKTPSTRKSSPTTSPAGSSSTSLSLVDLEIRPLSWAFTPETCR
jgi:hypothetical protein